MPRGFYWQHIHPDDVAAVRAAMEVLEELGYATIAATNGEAGLRVLRSATRVELLVTDGGLPGGR